MKQIEHDGKSIDYMTCGQGSKVILTFAGGWGPPQLGYDTILRFEKTNRIVIVDISPFADTESMYHGVDRVLEKENLDRVILLGQSFSGIIAQIYFRARYQKTDGMILTNTLAPKAEHSKKWVLVLIRLLPLSIFKPLIKKKMSKLSKFEKPVSEEIQEQRRFSTALLTNIMDQYFTSRVLRNAISLTFDFNEKNGYKPDEFNNWKGRVLLITSEDEPYYPDAEKLSQTLPHSIVYKLPSGYGHVSPMIHKEEFHTTIQQFINDL
jgi:pimeloyl-ACP methyl ester carboxylesterase